MKTKLLPLLALPALLATACSIKDFRLDCLTPVTVHVSDFLITSEDLPDSKAPVDVNSYNGVKTLTLAFYDSSNAEVYKSTQTKGSSGFGEFSLSLPIGTYTMVALGYVLYDDDELTLTSPTQAGYSVNAPRETFAATQEVNVTGTTALNLTATLDRIVACLQVISTDGRTDNANKVRMTFSAGGKQFSPTTGLATVNTGSVSTVSNNFTVGTSSTSTGFVFLATDEQTMNVTIETLDESGDTIYSQTITDVPFKRNRRTKLSGALYSAGTAVNSFQLNTGWVDDEALSF